MAAQFACNLASLLLQEAMGKSVVLWILQLDDTWFLGHVVFPHMVWGWLITVAFGLAAAFLAGGRVRAEYAVACAAEIVAIKVACTAASFLLARAFLVGSDSTGRSDSALLLPILYIIAPAPFILFKEALFRGDWSKPVRPGFRVVPCLTPWRMVRKNALFAVAAMLSMADILFDELATRSGVIVKGPYWLWPLAVEVALLVFFLDATLGIGLRLAGVRLEPGQSAAAEQTQS